MEAILILQKKQGMVRSVDVARHMNVSKPSVCHAVGILREGGFLIMDEEHYLHLTDIGREVAATIYERHVSLQSSLYPQAFPMILQKPTPAGWSMSSAKQVLRD